MSLSQKTNMSQTFNVQMVDEAREALRGIVSASAGNHAQGVAFSCAALEVRGTIFMPRNTPRQKIDRVHALGGKYVTVELTGDAFDEAYEASRKMSEAKRMAF